MIIYDINYYIKQITEGNDVIEEGFSVVEFNLLEWLKGKDKCLRKREFAKFDSFIKEKKGSYCFRNSLGKKESLLNDPKTPFQYKYVLAEKIAFSALKELIDFCVTTLFMIMIIVAIKKNKTVITNGEILVQNDGDAEIVLINQSLKHGTDMVLESGSKKMARDFIELNKEEIDKWFVRLYNEIASVFNKNCNVIKIKTIETKRLNLNQLTENCSIKIKESDVDNCVDALVHPRNNERETKLLFKKLISSVLIGNQSFEFNHIADLYIQYAADCLGADFKSIDKKRIKWRE